MTKTASVLEAVANTAYQLRSDVEQREGHVNVKEISPFGAGPRPNNRCGVVWSVDHGPCGVDHGQLARTEHRVLFHGPH
jgi:hypothetical protein